jgi:hypothetical protein
MNVRHTILKIFLPALLILMFIHFFSCRADEYEKTYPGISEYYPSNDTSFVGLWNLKLFELIRPESQFGSSVNYEYTYLTTSRWISLNIKSDSTFIAFVEGKKDSLAFQGNYRVNSDTLYLKLKDDTTIFKAHIISFSPTKLIIVMNWVNMKILYVYERKMKTPINLGNSYNGLLNP